MNNDQPGGPLKVPIGQARQRSRPADTDAKVKAEAAQAESRLQKATGAIKEAFRNTRHT